MPEIKKNLKVLPRRRFGDPILRKPTELVSPDYLKTTEFKNLVDQMFYTIRQVKGAGLAAPQIGKSLRFSVVEIRKERRLPNMETLAKTVIINPRILKRSQEMWYSWEGCLSLPGMMGIVPRYKEITMEFLDGAGKKQKWIVKNWI